MHATDEIDKSYRVTKPSFFVRSDRAVFPSRPRSEPRRAERRSGVAVGHREAARPAPLTAVSMA